MEANQEVFIVLPAQEVSLKPVVKIMLHKILLNKVALIFKTVWIVQGQHQILHSQKMIISNAGL